MRSASRSSSCSRRATPPGVEDPGDADVINVASSEGSDVQRLPIDRDGLVLTVDMYRCKCLFVTPSHQFPATVRPGRPEGDGESRRGDEAPVPRNGHIASCRPGQLHFPWSGPRIVGSARREARDPWHRHGTAHADGPGELQDHAPEQHRAVGGPGRRDERAVQRVARQGIGPGIRST